VSISEKFHTLAQLIEMVKFLHALGFAHNVPFMSNVVVRDKYNIPGTMTLIHFGASRPVCDLNGSPTTIGSPVRSDMLLIGQHLRLLDPNEYSEYF
jgi:hypothetical protein